MKRFKPQTSRGPAERFTGSVYPTIIFAGEAPSRARMASVHFEPGARSAWHKHAVGQYIHVMEGTAYMQERGGKINILKPGETVYTGPGVEHWHGASPDSYMVHIVVWEALATDAEETVWLKLVTDEEYNEAAKADDSDK
jgi:quercetin dioxygenase-like cupin family protein